MADIRQKLGPADVTALCNAAQAAWDNAPPRARRVRFSWQGNPYVSTLTNFRMLVQTPDGKPLCCRYY
jgi:hypothetical protein